MAVNRSDQQYLEGVWRFDVASVDGEHNVASLANVNRKAATTWADIQRTNERRSADQTLAPGARLLSSANFAKAALQRQRGEFEAARDGARDKLGALRRTLERHLDPPSDPGQAVLYREIREHLRGLPMAERIRLVQEADKSSGDKRILHAAVSGPALVGMLPAAVHEEYRNAYLIHVAADDWGHAERIAMAIDRAEAGQAQLEEHAKAVIDFATAEAVERSAA